MEHDPAHTQPLKLETGKLGGLKHLERLLGLRTDDDLSTDDAVFVSLDLEVASDRQRLHLSTEKPLVTQVAFASLDTRNIRSLTESSDLRSLISVHMFEVMRRRPTSKKATKKLKKGQQCTFAQTRFIASEEVSTAITQNLCIRDDLAGPDNNHLRNIVLVGHSWGRPADPATPRHRSRERRALYTDHHRHTPYLGSYFLYITQTLPPGLDKILR